MSSILSQTTVARIEWRTRTNRVDMHGQGHGCTPTQNADKTFHPHPFASSRSSCAEHSEVQFIRQATETTDADTFLPIDQLNFLFLRSYLDVWIGMNQV